MPEKPTLLVPLRSNGNTLLAGGPVNAFRRRLKFASVVYDRILLEGGVLRLSAGPNMSFSAVEPYNPADPPRWQTAAARHAAERQPFVLAMGKEDTSGVPAATMRTMGSSDTTISWVATLYPFADEILDVADWMDFVRFPDLDGSAGRLADQWTWADERNPALESAVPVRFVRDTVIKNVNRDLALATASGFAATIDPFHQRVVAQRFNDEGWKLQGYVVPILFPAVGDWSWSAIADLRQDRSMARFRAVLQEVEAEAITEAASGDIEAAAHHVYEKHLASAAKVEKVTAPIRHTAGGLVISGAASAGTTAAGFTGLAGFVISTVAGGIIGGILDVRAYIRQRRARGWVAVHNQIRGS
jgi:hypothetical protein